MIPAEVITFLRQFNERCRDCQFEDKHRVMEAIDAAVEMIERTNTLEMALRDVAQTLAWLQHGRCRGFSEGPILTTNEALDAARAALEKSK